MIISGTGHRIVEFPGYSGFEVRQTVKHLAKRLFKEIGVSCVISGMASGYDELLAEAALEESIPLHAALPFPLEKTATSRRIILKPLLDMATKITVCSEDYHPRCYFIRDEFMVNESNSVLSWYDGRKEGGTYYTVKYAAKQNKKIYNIYKLFLKFLP